MLPLINNNTSPERYLGIEVSLGGSPALWALRPTLRPFADNKPILEIGIGASTPSQIFAAYEIIAKSMKAYQFKNCGLGAQSIDDMLNPSGPIWANVDQKLAEIGRKRTDVQKILMCQDDLENVGTGIEAIEVLHSKLRTLIRMMKGPSYFPNLKHIEFVSRYNGDKLDKRAEDMKKFLPPSDYNNGFSNKLVVMDCIANGGRLDTVDGVYVNDSCGYIYTDGEQMRSDGFKIMFKWFKKKGGSIHLDTNQQGDEITAQFIFDNQKNIYPEYH